MRSVDGVPVNEAILRAATLAFIELGYDNASMDEVAARAATTKRTVYSHFGSKEALFRSAVSRAVTHVQAEMPPLTDASDPFAELTRFAVAFAELNTRRAAVHLQRVVMGAADRFGDLAVLLHREVLGQAERRVADYLRRIEAAGGARADVPDPDALAALFLNATSGRLRFETLFGTREPLGGPPGTVRLPDADRAAVGAAVAFFLRRLRA